VLLYEECEVYRIGLRVVLEGTSDIVVVGEAATLEVAVESVATTVPGVALVGVLRPEQAAVAVLSFREQAPKQIPVLILAAEMDPHAVRSVLAAGARGYLHRDTPVARLIAAISTVAAGGLVLGAPAADSLVGPIAAPQGVCQVNASVVKGHPSLDLLTPRQQEVLRLVAEGLSNIDIARRMQLSVATVKSHLSGTLQKLDVRDRTQLAVLAYQIGLRRPPNE
jgi:DNA-binding NarL/FixJ family response regulator